MKKKRLKKQGKVSKGAPSGFMISLIFHAAVFFLAGLFIVFKVLPKPQPVFKAPPPVERPKMHLKKPKVRVKKSSTPKPSSRIVAKVKTAKMPDIQIPDLTGTGTGLLGGTGMGGDFLDMPDIGEATLMGSNVSAGKDLEVTWYCMARNRSGGANPKMSHQQYFNILRKFVKDGWDTEEFAPYYRSPRTLYASCIAIPIVTSMVGPISFGENDYVLNARTWVAHYHGKIVKKDGITFRFWGTSDDVLDVAINKKLVLAANFPWNGVDAYTIGEEQGWKRTAPGSRTINANDGSYQFFGTRPDGSSVNSLVGSDWITLKPGQVYDFDAIAGEGPGGETAACLMVQVKGVDYPKNDRGEPIWPLFATEPLSWETQDKILMDLQQGSANVTNISTFFIDE